MRKSIILVLGCVAILIVGAITANTIPDPEPESDFIEDTMEQAERVKSVLGDEWELEVATVVEPQYYQDAQGNTMVYHFCTTVRTAPLEDELDIQAISRVIDPEEAESSRECEVNGRPAVIYAKDGREYLGWTLSDEHSCVIEYTPGVISEADLMKTAESVTG